MIVVSFAFVYMWVQSLTSISLKNHSAIDRIYKKECCYQLLALSLHFTCSRGCFELLLRCNELLLNVFVITLTFKGKKSSSNKQNSINLSLYLIKSVNSFLFFFLIIYFIEKVVFTL